MTTNNTFGRPLGVPNKATIERALIAERTVEGARESGKPLAKEVLEEFMLIFRGMAAAYQPAPPNQPRKPHQDEDSFERWGRLACEQAKALAPYQSPTFRAVMVAPAPEKPRDNQPKRFSLTVFDNHGRVVMGEVMPPVESERESA